MVAFDISLRHVQVSGSCCRLGIVGKLVRPGQEHHVALRILQLIDSSSFIALSGVALVISDRVIQGEYSLVQDRVRICVHRDHIVTFFQNIAARALFIKGCHIFLVKIQCDYFALAGLEHAGLGKAHQIGAGLLNAAVCIRRIEVHFHHVLSCSRACVGDSHVHTDLCAVHRQVAHFLLEGCVGQAVTEGELHCFVIVNDAFGRGCLIKFIADVDILHIVSKCR